MLHAKDDNIAFIHVPKNAGKSVAKALRQNTALSYEALAQDLQVSEARAAELLDGTLYDIPELGPIKPIHLPLPFLESHFPATWNTLAQTRSFMLVRASRERFLSALLQRIREFGQHVAVRVDDPAVQKEAGKVCDWLAGKSAFCDMRYIHFSRQIDYAELRGRRIIQHIFPLERLDVLSAWMKYAAGIPLNIPRDHARREPRKWACSLQPAARFIGRNLLPYSIKKTIYPLWMNSPAFTNAAARYEAVRLPDEVETFIARYYAPDDRLHAEALATMAATASSQSAMAENT